MGHYIERSLRDTTNVKFRLNEFYSKFNSVLRNFNNINISTLLFLFNSYCLPNFGVELWNSKKLVQDQYFKVFETAFGCALKRMCNVPRYASSHVIAERCNQLLLSHLVSKIQLRYYKRLINHKNAIIRLNFPFLGNGFCIPYIEGLFKLKYEVSIADTDFHASQSRIGYVQRNEERSRFCPYYNI